MRRQRREYSMLFSALRSLALALALCVSWAPAARPQANIAHSSSSAVEKIHIRAVGPIAITVEDMDHSVDFYTHVLTFENISDTEVAGDDVEHLFGVFGSRVRIVTLKLGGESIQLLQFLAPKGRPIPVDSRSNDVWFQHIAIIVSDMDRAYAVLRRNKVEHASSGPQRLPDWNKNAGGIKAFYFKDPDEHPVEILQFPEGKGDPRWQHAGDRLFLGIDHTAIVVSDTDASLRFYRDLLGLRVVGTSDNYGSEQEHLNNVFGAHLRITTLRAARGPGVEFLEYLAPRTGRPIPADTQADDLWYWQVNMRAAAPETVVKAGTTLLHDGMLGWSAGVIARDPDGHASLIA